MSSFTRTIYSVYNYKHNLILRSIHLSLVARIHPQGDQFSPLPATSPVFSGKDWTRIRGKRHNIRYNLTDYNRNLQI
ncbi:MAG: hypothetical protein Q8S84_01940 [bacterium]|nr:hypothetical protein [bacterium]MDP3380317.1 hypothetical protein [bacterium]